jgi:hypothetical protein
VEMYCDVSGDTVRPKLLRTFPPWDTRYAKPGDDAFRLAVDNQRLLELVTTMCISCQRCKVTPGTYPLQLEHSER